MVWILIFMHLVRKKKKNEAELIFRVLDIDNPFLKPLLSLLRPSFLLSRLGLNVAHMIGCPNDCDRML